MIENMKKNTIVGRPPKRSGLLEDMIGMIDATTVTVECRCPRCKKTFTKRLMSGHVDERYLKSGLCPACEKEYKTEKRLEKKETREKERKQKKVGGLFGMK